MLNNSNIRFFLVILALPCFFLFCKREEIRLWPNVPVRVEIFIDPDLAGLGVGQAMTYNHDYQQTGIAGLIIYREQNNEFKVFERLCTYFPKDTCAVELQEDLIFAVCPCCSSEYLITADGYPLKGSKAIFPLIQYNTVVSNNRLIIYK
jgi:hypothetical protein